VILARGGILWSARHPQRRAPSPLDLSGEASILVGVHSVLRESLAFGDISVSGVDRIDRVDNLLKVHI
jgi:hypothetical protein